MTSAWADLTEAIAAAPYPVTVLDPDRQRATESLSELGMTTNSWLGAVVANSGGLLVDHGWLRVLGSGRPGVVAEAGRLLVAHDVLGGQFAWLPNAAGQPTIHYFGPDNLEWQDLGHGYADWLSAMLGGSLDGFYETLRWPGWAAEVATVGTDEGIHLWPPPWSAEGKDLAAVSRKVIPLGELVSFHHKMADEFLAGGESI